MNRSLIIGYGNTLRGDDGLGPYIIEQLSMMTGGKFAGQASFLSVPQLDIALLPEMCNISNLIFIDARRDESDELVRVEEIRPRDRVQALHTSHSVGIGVLLRLAVDWYNAAPLCYAVLPKGYDFCIVEGLSDQAKIAADLAIEKVLAILKAQN